jgi:hypothetical protein
MNAWTLVGMAAALLAAVVAIAAAIVSRRAAIRTDRTQARTDEQLRRLEELRENPVRIRLTPAGEAAVATAEERRPDLANTTTTDDLVRRWPPLVETAVTDHLADRADLEEARRRWLDTAMPMASGAIVYQESTPLRFGDFPWNDPNHDVMADLAEAAQPRAQVKLTAACPVCPGTAGPFYEPAEYAAHIREHHRDLTTERSPDV